MPGISLVQDDEGPGRPVYEDALDSVQFFEHYRADRVYDGDRTAVAATGYEGYPVEVVEIDGGVVVLEGELYGVDDVDDQLRDVGEHLLADRTDPVEAWSRSRDGDFLVAAIDGDTGRTRVVTDPLGRLPVYVATVGDRTVVTRELGFCREYTEAVGAPLSVDKLAVAQTLHFGYRLGTRTLFEDVSRLPPAAIATVDDGVDVDRYHRQDYGDTPHGRRDVETNVSELVGLFEDACERRSTVGEDTVIALSGGLDSRAVAGGFEATGQSVRAVTFDRPDGSNQDEVEAAKAVAERLDLPWESTVASGSAADRSRLLETKQGMNSLRLAFMVDFVAGIDGGPGETTLVTGDGGDKALPDLTPGTSIENTDQLVQYVRTHNRILDADEAAAIAGIDEQRLVDSVRKRVASYPESDPEALYVHFLVRERGMNWLFHGEDRNRYYHWSVSPFYSWPFFEYAMGIPAEQKSDERLQERFLSSIAPELIDVEYVNFGAPITSAEYRVKRAVYDALVRYPTVRDSAVRLLKQFKGDPTVTDSDAASEVRRAVAEQDALDEGLPGESASTVLGDLESYSTVALYQLLTVARVLDEEADPERGASAGDATGGIPQGT